MIPRIVQEKLASFEPTWSPGLYKGVLIGFFVMAFVIPLGLVAFPHTEFLNGMAAQPKAKAQMSYGRLYDEQGFGFQVERDPPKGTMPRGYYPYEFENLGFEDKDLKVVGAQLANPLPVSIEHMKRGQKLFGTYCAVCHGQKGHGDGSIVGPKLFPAPPSLHTDRARTLPDGALHHLITKGTKKMPSYRDKLEPEERWQVVLYLRALQRAESPKEEDLK